MNNRRREGARLISIATTAFCEPIRKSTRGKNRPMESEPILLYHHEALSG